MKQKFSRIMSAVMAVIMILSVLPMTASADEKALFKVGDALYDDLNEAVAAGTTVVLDNDGTLPAGYYTIPAGVTLLIPKDEENTVYTNMPERYDRTEYNYITPTAYRTLKMEAGANIIVEGAISIAGSQYAGGTGNVMGGVYGPVGFIRMDTGSKITVNNGAYLYAWGYIVGSGEVEVLRGGTVYESVQIKDWRGGSATSALITDDNNNVFPVSQYYVQNIEVPMKLNAGAVEKGYTCTTVTLAGISGVEVTLIGTGEANLFTIDSGYLIKDYDEATDRQSYKAYGNITMKRVRISGRVTPLMALTLDSNRYVLPVTNNITFEMCSGTISINHDLCILPGAEIIVHNGARCIFVDGKSIFVYDVDEWGGYVGVGNSRFIPLDYAPGRTFNRTTLSDAKIQIDGTVIASQSFLYTTKSGAVVTSTGTGVVVMNSGTATETYQISQESTDTYTVSIPVVVAKLQNADGTTTDPSKEINPEAGTVYTYTDGKWVAKCRNSTCVSEGQASCASPLPCKFCGDMIKPGHKYTSVVRTAATCTADGERVFTCSVCNDSYTEAIPATGEHSYKGTVTAPTCIEKGYTTYTCSGCGDSYYDDFTAITDHADKDGDNLCDYCDKSLKNDEVNNCSHMCHKSGFLGFIWKVINFFQKLFGISPVCECGAAHY